MRLSNEKRVEVVRHLVNMVYPKSFYTEIGKRILDTISNTEMMKTARMLAEKYPEYVVTQNNIRFYYDDDYGYINIDPGYKFAWNGTFRIGVRFDTISNPKHEAFAKEIRDFKRDADNYRDKVHAVVYSCNTTRQLYEVLPEMKGFFDEEDGTGGRAIVPKTLIDEVRKMIPKEIA